MSKITARFTLERETKGALRYQEVGRDGNSRTTSDADAVIGTVYLRKSALDGLKPDEIVLSIETEAEDDSHLSAAA